MRVVVQVPLVRHDCEQWLATTAGGGLANTMVFEALYNKIFETLGATHDNPSQTKPFLRTPETICTGRLHAEV